MWVQHQVDQGRGRVRGDQEGDREAGHAAPGAHRRVRGGQRAPPHGAADINTFTWVRERDEISYQQTLICPDEAYRQQA
jgi:hypothetical protein